MNRNLKRKLKVETTGKQVRAILMHFKMNHIIKPTLTENMEKSYHSSIVVLVQVKKTEPCEFTVITLCVISQ